jgi:aspartate racemase
VLVLKKLGLVGGIGPESTLEYYKGIIEGYRRRTGLDRYPQMVIDSLDLSEMYAYASNKQWEPFTERLAGSIRTLAAAGAEFAAMAANTAHIVFDELERTSPLPLVSIVEETCKVAWSKGCRRVVIFGTAFTMSSGLYTKSFEKRGMEAFVPSEEEQGAIHGIIFPHLQEGIVLPEEKEKILGIANGLIKGHGADALVLGCTELPLIIKEGDLDTLVLDTTRIHVEAILDTMLGGAL